MLLSWTLLAAPGQTEWTPESGLREGASTPAEPAFVGPELVQALLRNGSSRPLLLAAWATWCLPCQAELPQLEALSRQGEVNVVLLAVDEPAQPVGPTLARLAPSARALRLAPADLAAAFPDWPGKIPAVWVVSPGGSRRELLTGPQPRAALDRAIDAVLSTNSSP